MSLSLSRPMFDPIVVSWIGTAVAVGYAAYVTYQSAKHKKICQVFAKGTQINPSIKKDEPKVVDTLDMEDLGKKSVFCRCWKSKKFPYCDGSHAAHNKETGDNVGPLIIQNNAAT